MNKKILVIGLVCTFLIAGLTTSSAFVVNLDIITTDTGQIVSQVRDKDEIPGPEPKGIEGIRLVLKNEDETLTLEGITDDNGQYIFDNIPYGIYEITAYGRFGYFNETIKDISFREPVFYVIFLLTKKSRSNNYFNSVLLELFQHFSLLSIFNKYYN